MSLKDILEELERFANEAMKTKPKKINEGPALPNTRGVYLITKKDQVIYIGQGKHLRKRMNQHLLVNKDAKKSAFRRALHREWEIEYHKTKDWITDNCRIAIKEIENSDMCKLVESLLIAYYRTINKELLNS